MNDAYWLILTDKDLFADEYKSLADWLDIQFMVVNNQNLDSNRLKNKNITRAFTRTA